MLLEYPDRIFIDVRHGRETEVSSFQWTCAEFMNFLSHVDLYSCKFSRTFYCW
uniref:Rhodanese domain-containing protein n=1 Tax=Ascaris lumbricoides TaxID=6252 RepID=A0A0M3HTQ7_ASCLU